MNTYHIEGLQVPKLEEALASLRAEVDSIRTLQHTLADALIRVDKDVQLILTALGIPEEEQTGQ